MSDPEANPYTTPSVQAPVAPGVVHTAGGQALQSPVTRGRVAMGFVIAFVVFGSLSNLLVPLIPRLIEETPPAEARSIGFVLMALAFLTFGTFIGAVISVCMWTYRCASNARIIAPLRMSMSAGMAVGSYFIPFYNLFGPYRAMCDTVEITQEASGRSGIRRLVLPWWLCWIFANFLERISSKFAEQSPEGPAYVLILLSISLILAAGVLLCVIITKLSAAQDSIELAPSQPVSPVPPIRRVPSGVTSRAPVAPAPAVPASRAPGAPAPRRPEDGQP